MGRQSTLCSRSFTSIARQKGAALQVAGTGDEMPWTSDHWYMQLPFVRHPMALGWWSKTSGGT